MNTRVYLDNKKILKVLLKDGRFFHICTFKNLAIGTRLPIFWFIEEKGHLVDIRYVYKI
jgi:hypothetical protein